MTGGGTDVLATAVILLVAGLTCWMFVYRRERRAGSPSRIARRRGAGSTIILLGTALTGLGVRHLPPEIAHLAGPGWRSDVIPLALLVAGAIASFCLGEWIRTRAAGRSASEQAR